MIISKDDGDKILEEFLICATKENGTTECAKESIKIIDNFNDAQLVISMLVRNSLRMQGQLPEEVVNFEVSILSAISMLCSECLEDANEIIPVPFRHFFNGNEDFDDIIGIVSQSKSINFAVQSFVSSFYLFREFEKKYPEISKMI